MEILRYKTPAGFNGVANRLAWTSFQRSELRPGNKAIPVDPVDHFLFIKRVSWDGREKIQ